MRPMTASEAWQIERDPYAAPDDFQQARRILDALVEWRTAYLARREGRWAHRTQPLGAQEHASERKLAALERGEEPQETKP